MSTSYHDAQPLGDIHIVPNWQYADATTRLAATGFVSGDVLKVAYQIDTQTLWLLVATTPTWVIVGAISPYVPPILSSFTWLNQGGAVASNNGSTLLMSIPDSGSSLDWRLLYKAAPTPPYSLVVCISYIMSNFNSQASGIYFYDTGSGDLSGFEFLTQAGSVRAWTVRNFPNPTSGGTIVYQSPGTTWRGPDTSATWMRLRNDGTTLYYDISLDGSNWHNLYSQLVSAYVTPNSIAFGGLCLTGGGFPFLDVDIISWTTTNSAAF